MPVVKRLQISDRSTLLIWKITEGEQALLELSGFSGIVSELASHPQKRKEFLAVRALLRSAGFADDPSYDKNGKPYLPASALSISHCFPFVGVLLSMDEVGLDIQDFNPVLRRIRKKFMSSSEMDEFPDDRSCLLIWSAKEAVFKKYSDAHLFFERDMTVTRIDDNSIHIRVEHPMIQCEEVCSVDWVDDHAVVYCT